MTEAVAGTTTSVSPPLLQQSRLVELTGQGYSLHQVASAMLREALLASYPEQQIDPDHTMLASPLRDTDNTDGAVDTFSFEPLTHAFIQHCLHKTTADYIEGEHFLTRTPGIVPPILLPLSMDDVTSIMNERLPFVFLEYQQRQLDYWNESASTQPRWQELSDLLRSAVNVQSANGWDADECALARFVAQYPDKAERAASDQFVGLQACLMDIDQEDGKDSIHLLVTGALVLTATVKQRQRFVLYTVADGHESFDSLTQLGASLPERMNPQSPVRSLKWRLIEPDANIFDALAQALVANQLGAIATLDPASQPTPADSASGQRKRARLNPLEQTRTDQLEAAIPDWLSRASNHDQQAYSRYITELGTLRDGAEAEVFKDDDIPLIAPYAQRQMREAIMADVTAEGAAELPLDDLQITVTNSFETAGFTLPNPFDRVHETLGQFALQNTAPYQATIAFKDRRALPAWLTVDFLTAKAEQVNIGEHYPKLLKRTLIDNPIRAAEQKTRYMLQLPTLLPLLALEAKLQQHGHVDERGYAYVCQLMAAISSKQPESEHSVTIRPLAFIPRRRLSKRADTVANMFIISPRDTQGPCLLYRPALDMPLLQFASAQNLMYALYQPGELRNSVLAWLETAALSFEYAQYVFATGLPSPWIVTQLASEPFMHLDLTGPIGLQNAPLTGDILASLHAANSQTLVELANRQSLSNSERRWTLLADSGWAIFSVASNFMSGAAGVAVWVWQTLEQIQQAIDAHERDDNFVAWRSTADVLLTVGIILTQRVVAQRGRSLLPRRKTTSEPPERFSEAEIPSRQHTETTVVIPPAATLDPVGISGELPAGHRTQLEPGLSRRPDTSKGFLAMLDSFKVTMPELDGKSVSAASHLYEADGKTYAPVGSRWFQVIAAKEQPVHIIDPLNPLREGMALKYDAAAKRWHWDTRLRLRGGMPKSRIAAFQRSRAQAMASAWAALEQFEMREPEEKRQLLHALMAIPRDTTEAGFARTAPVYLDKAVTLGNDYSQGLLHLEEWHRSGGGGLVYQSKLMSLTLGQHRSFGSWLRVKMRMYAKTTEKFVASAASQTLVPRNEQIEIAIAATAMSDEMIATLQTLNSSLQVLRNHPGKTREIAQHLTNLLPDFNAPDLKANEIGMSFERCVKEQPGPAMDSARHAIGTITALGADASHELVLLSKKPLTADGQTARVEHLSRWNDLFAILEERISQLPTAHPDLFVQDRLDRISQLIGEFHELTRARLTAELPEPEQLPAPTRPRPQTSASQPKVKVSKSRPRPEDAEQSSSAQSSEPPEETAAFVKLSAQQPKSKAPADDMELISTAMELNLHIDSFSKRTREDAKRPGRIPADIRDMFDQQVARLNQAASDVDMAMVRRRASTQDPLPIASLSAELRAGATRTHNDGVAAYAALLKQRKPRETYFQWLHSNGQVEVVKDERGRIRTRNRRDYFQEYRILDKTNANRPLWVAHFHYDLLTDADELYTVAHLKFADAYLQTLDAKTRQTLDSFDAVDNALRRIVDPQVRDLFFKPAAKE